MSRTLRATRTPFRNSNSLPKGSIHLNYKNKNISMTETCNLLRSCTPIPKKVPLPNSTILTPIPIPNLFTSLQLGFQIIGTMKPKTR